MMGICTPRDIGRQPHCYRAPMRSATTMKRNHHQLYSEEERSLQKRLSEKHLQIWLRKGNISLRLGFTKPANKITLFQKNTQAKPLKGTEKVIAEPDL
ncbi:hypothetical protein CDAR_110561 [Caerostris darwini]|uniref:Uncharacterized protein n=1 Tax=Caerostris darwini TaxID=1538125 RepID=A0AAV4QJS0_9ARAC|nr:hypothetical protein CDAR_110561 [Caerostris darwini]